VRPSQLHHDPLSAPADRFDSRTNHFGVPLRLPRYTEFFLALSNSANCASGNQWPQVADNGFDLGQFGHGSSILDEM
jgi:hypothetical protein